jgi:Tol biopolymer transport system component
MDKQKSTRFKRRHCTLSTVFAVTALALLSLSLLSFPVHAGQWSLPIQVTFNMNIAYDWGGPSISADGTKIVFQRYTDGYYQVFVANTDGSGVTQVTHDQRNYVHLSISGDGSKIAATSYADSYSNADAYVINSDGTGVIHLFSKPFLSEAPQISDDGSKVAFIAMVEGISGINYELFVVNSDGTGLTQLTNNTEYDNHPSISSDGSKIAFLSNNDVFVINSDGTGLTQLINTNASISSPSISGDGSKVAFVRDEGVIDFNGSEPIYPNSEIFVVNSDGTGLTQVTDNTLRETMPSINYDGSKITFYSYTNGPSEIFAINADGTGFQQITQNEKNDSFPSISGDGNKIAFISFDGADNGEIFVSVDVAQDSNAPVTVADYDNSWHVIDYNINLTATDDLSGVAETHYKINGGSTQTVSINGQPLITTEGADNTLEYWSIDAAGNEETHKVLSGIKLDKTAPIGSITINNEAESTSSQTVTLSLSATDSSGIAQMRFSNNETSWTSWETYTTSKNWTLPSGDGEKTVYVQFKDNGGWVSQSYSATILLDTAKEGTLPIELILAGATGTAITTVALLYIRKVKFSAKN